MSGVHRLVTRIDLAGPLASAAHGTVVADAVLDIEPGRPPVARVIRDSKADVVTLQEVDRHYSARSNWADQAEELGRRLRMQVTFGANIDNPPPADRPTRIQYGTAILSRIPMKPAGNTHLYRSPDQEQRGLLHAVVDVRGVKVDVYNTHMAASSAFDRGQQATQIVDLIGEPKRPTVLMGDLNATADAPEIKTLTGLLNDVWPVVGSGPGNTIESLNPTKRIDYVLVSDDVKAKTAEVVTTTPEASDHLPVIAELQVRSGPRP